MLLCSLPLPFCLPDVAHTRARARARTHTHLLTHRFAWLRFCPILFDSVVSSLSPSGKAGLTFEHSWGDGVAVLRYCNEVSDGIVSQSKRTHPQTLHVRLFYFVTFACTYYSSHDMTRAHIGNTTHRQAEIQHIFSGIVYCIAGATKHIRTYHAPPTQPIAPHSIRLRFCYECQRKRSSAQYS